MLPRPSPVMSAVRTSIKKRSPRRPFLSRPGRLLLHADRQDLVVDELRPDVVVLVDGVVVGRAERLPVVLDQAVVAGDLVETLAHLRALGRAGVLDPVSYT